MMRWLWIPLLAVTVLPGDATAAGGEKSNAHKNVVLFVADDLGFQAGCYGDSVVRTPGIDRLAAEGTRFTQAYCTTASCSASRSVLMSGLQNHAIGHYGHAHGYNHFSTYATVRSLPVLLAEAGYRTCSIGKYHLAPEPVYHFETYRNEGSQGHRNAVRMAQNAREWLAENDDRPFFLYFCTSDPHRGSGPGKFSNDREYPSVTPVRYDPEEIVVPPWLPETPEVRHELAEYYQAISRMDQGLERLLEGLHETGHWEDTLIIFLSDNGPPFPGAKTCLYEPGANLPLIVRHPQQKRKDITCDAMVTWTDVVPTILDYCNVVPPDAPPIKPAPYLSGQASRGKRVPYRFHGRSFLPVLEESSPEGWDEIYLSHTFHEITMYYPMRSVREGRYKYVLNIAHPLPFPFASDLYASPTWQGVLSSGREMYGKRTAYAYVNRPEHELYDLVADPHEINNLAYDPKHQETLERLQSKLKAWQRRTRDPWILKWRYE